VRWLLLVALDGAAVAHAGLVGVFPGAAEGATLVEVVVGLVELHFELLEASVLVVAQAFPLVAMEQLLLLLDQFVDAVEYLLIVHGRWLPDLGSFDHPESHPDFLQPLEQGVPHGDGGGQLA
jgi:hypothetical protein